MEIRSNGMDWQVLSEDSRRREVAGEILSFRFERFLHTSRLLTSLRIYSSYT